MSSITSLAAQWQNGPKEARRRLIEMLEDATGRFDMDARSRAALAYLLVTSLRGPELPRTEDEGGEDLAFGYRRF